MKKLFQLCLLISMSANLLAECGYGGISAFPKGDHIYQNSQIMIEAYEWTREIVRGLNHQYPVYLQSDGHRVSLRVIEICEGDYRLNQAILKPEEKLIAGQRYFLKIDSLKEEDQQLLHKGGNDKDKSSVSWTVIAGTDTERPGLLNEPQLIDQSITAFGCGPAVYTIFEFNANDKSELLVQTELTDLTTNEVTTYYLRTLENKIQVGHGMCSGAFDYKSDGSYQVRFKLQDASGNDTVKWTKPVKFDRP